MSEWKCRVEIQVLAEDVVELRLFDFSDKTKYLSWKMLLSEARDLASWWNTEGLSPQNRKLPVNNVRYRSIQLSMFTPSLVQVKGFDPHGSPKIVGWSLPAPMVEALRNYFSAHEEPIRPGDRSGGHEGERGQRNSSEAAIQRQSPTTDRIVVYFFQSDPQKRHHTTTQDGKSADENRKEDLYHVAR